MSRPTIFFSHSPQDKKPMTKLKELFIEKTSETIDVFLSSDGTSIPFGQNWVHRVETALEECKLMFVFLTPASLQSKWIYFEAGYCYAKGVRVIPVGFLGVDLTKLSPPISLLQGFNISSEASLNNFIAIINDVFKVKHKESFMSEEYQILTTYGDPLGRNSFPEALSVFETILFMPVDTKKLKMSITEVFDTTKKILHENGLDSQDGPSYEVSFSGGRLELMGGQASPSFRLTIDPLVAERYFGVISEMFTAVCHGGIQAAYMDLNSLPTVKINISNLNMSAKLADSACKLSPEGGYVFRNFRFLTYSTYDDNNVRCYCLRVIPETPEWTLLDLVELVELLVDRGIIFQ